ncbi:glycoside hydrolase family 43 protein [Paenibacillus sp. ACRSA]|uniref:glycoside hydrolase family 43 protein n=1 Tax=Paenibacillus sp. ACRSA TaxID=2918211 RepID=UPI001EF6A27F|nr:glycoside hydrolase family 43 protein [Paenibacillus sp. ACRSA]MCG7379763.1 glycoside hydrolase family 43 protein [Paenibacillus sp. ACRSA]
MSSNLSLYGYVFAHFIGDQEDGEQVYFALSKDGLHWQDLNQNQPVLRSDIGEKGGRDPFLLRGVDHNLFYLIATDLSIYHRGGWERSQPTVNGSHALLIWESTDLVNWSEPRSVEVAPREAGCVWAPEAIYDEEEGNYLVFWASSTLSKEKQPQGMHIYASRTKDFRTFTQAELYITRGERGTIIDTSIIRADDMYYRASGDGHITIESCKRLNGDWKHIATLDSLGLGLTGNDVEGPAFFKFNNEEKWGLFVDQYSSNGGYLPILTSQIDDTSGASWQKLHPEQYSFGSLKKRHGSILPITNKEYDTILAQWGNGK